MRPALTTWLLGGLLALGTTAGAQAPPGSEEKVPQVTTTETETTTTTTTTTEHTITKEEVKTWTMEIDGKEYEAHPSTPSYEGTTGLFHMPSAYTLPKSKFSFSLFRDNLDRDPKDEDISIHGLSLGYGISVAPRAVRQLRAAEPHRRRRPVPARASSTTIPSWPRPGRPGWATSSSASSTAS